MELTITKEKVLAAAEKCSTAKNVLESLFPEVFEKKITIVKTSPFVDGFAPTVVLHDKTGYKDTTWLISLENNEIRLSNFYTWSIEKSVGNWGVNLLIPKIMQ